MRYPPPAFCRSFPRGRVAAPLLLVLTAASAISGCNLLAAGAVILERDKKVDVEAAYDGLAGRRVAVLVAADDATYFRYPRAAARVQEGVTVALAAALNPAGGADADDDADPPPAGVELLTPAAAERYVQRNPYWTTRRPASVMQDLGVDRLVTVDLNRYATHETGNRDVVRGVIDATVSVVEADGIDPDNRAFSRNVSVRFPDDDSNFGVIGGEAETVEAGALRVFADAAARLFHDHTLVIPARR